MEKTCYTCKNWVTRGQNRRGETVAAPLLRHGFAACKLGPGWKYLTYRREACPRYEPINATAKAARDQWMAGNSVFGVPGRQSQG